jgi:uncharacterized membrane protein HdeD (DUF308 family)
MKNKNLILRYFGLLLIIVGIALNIKMYVDQAYPSGIYFIFIGIGITQIVVSLLCKQLKKGWQLVWSLLPWILGYIFLSLT